MALSLQSFKVPGRSHSADETVSKKRQFSDLEIEGQVEDLQMENDHLTINLRAKGYHLEDSAFI